MKQDRTQTQKIKRGEEPEFFESDEQYYLWSASLKATPGRMALLEALQDESKPISAEDLQAKLSKKLNRATMYRTLEDLVMAGLIRRIDVSRDHALYEISIGRKHHHHAVCTSCGHIEDIFGCHSQELMKEARQSTKEFANLGDHSLEFFGMCIKCEANKS